MIKRIAMLTDNADPLAPLGGHEAGGENVYVLEISKALARLGWEVDIFTRWSYPKTSKIAKVTHNVQVIRLEAGPVGFISKEKLFPYMQYYVDKFLEYKEKNKTDYILLHGNYYLSGWAGVQLSKILGIPLVNTFHTLGIVKHNTMGNDDPSPEDRISKEKYVMENAHKVIATSLPMRDELVNLYNINPKNIEIISEGANIKRFVPVPQLLARRALRFGPIDLIVQYIGRLEKRKGIDILIEAVRILLKLLPNDKKPLLRVHIAGGEPLRAWKKQMGPEKLERQRIQNLVEKYKLTNIVRFFGGIDREDLPLHYSAADVTIVPSLYEPFGLVPLESMACGTPVIASKTGGLMYTIKDGKTGFLVTPKDAEAFAQKMFQLFTHPNLGKQMRENAIERVRRYFEWDKIGAQMSEFYHNTLIEYYWAQHKQLMSINSAIVGKNDKVV